MNWRRRVACQGNYWRGLLEACGLAVVVLVLVLSVIDELPQTNVPATFLFLIQLPVGWAALRLKPPPASSRWKRIGWEIAFAAGLYAVMFATTWVFVSVFQAQAYIRGMSDNLVLDFLIFTSCLLPYLFYRVLMKVFAAWLSLSRKSFLWMLVNSHLVTVFVLIVLASLLLRIQMYTESTTAYYPPGLMANIVLEFVRSIIPWLGVSIIILVVVIAIFFPPALIVSYLISRRFLRRISALTEVMKRVRQGDLSARVTPLGQDEIAQLQDYFNLMASELQRERDKVAVLLQNQRELSAVVSHELRTPISVMRAHIENDLYEKPEALPTALPASYRKDLQVLHHETLKLQDLVEDLFTLSQLDAQRLGLECRWVVVTQVLDQVFVSLKQVAWENKRIELSVQYLPALPLVWADERRLEQVLGNLVQNAIRHTPPGGIIMLQAVAAGRCVEIDVIDSGEGISRQDLPHIWERFYRGAQGSGSGRTGIGLSLVKELVEKMGGTVGVESQPGEGSRFWLHLTSNASSAS